MKSGLSFFDKTKLCAMLIVAIYSITAIAFNSSVKTLLAFNSDDNKDLGWVLLGILIFLTIYSLKKRLLIMHFGKLALWYDFHFFMGLFSFVIMTIHFDNSIGSGLFRIISLLLIFIFFNSVYGIIMHLFIPQILLSKNMKLLNNDTIKENIEKLGKEIRRLAEGKSGSFEDEREEDHTLIDYYEKKRALTQQWFLIRLMNNWTTYHISAVTALFVLIVLHVFSFYYY